APQLEAAASLQGAVAQAPAQVLQYELGVEAFAGLAGGRCTLAALAGDAAADIALPVRDEIARIETVQAQGHVPGQAWAPASLALAVQGAGRHARVQRVDARAGLVAAHVQLPAGVV